MCMTLSISITRQSSFFYSLRRSVRPLIRQLAFLLLRRSVVLIFFYFHRWRGGLRLGECPLLPQDLAPARHFNSSLPGNVDRVRPRSIKSMNWKVIPIRAYPMLNLRNKTDQLMVRALPQDAEVVGR